MKVIKIGDKFKATRLPEYFKDMTVGKVYTVQGFDEDGDPYFRDDKDDRNFALEFNSIEDYGVVWLDVDSIEKPILEERKKDKIRMELVDQGFPLALLELAKVMTWANQNKGYKDHDWKNIPNAENAFKGAAARHRVKFDAQRSFGNEMLDCTDEESGIIHLAHEAFNVLALLELALVGKVK